MWDKLPKTQESIGTSNAREAVMPRSSFPQLDFKRRRASGVLLRLGALVSSGLVACVLDVATDSDAELAVTEQAFTNQFNLNPIHEEITVESLHFLKDDVRNLLALRNARFDAINLPYAPAHFDNCTFRESSLALRGYQAEAVNHALEFPPPFACPSFLAVACSEPTVSPRRAPS